MFLCSQLVATAQPWVSDVSRAWTAPQGMEGRHVAVWASHGRYYDLAKGRWQWQRPRLFCTTEDIFTQTITVPFLMPMLENAGAVTYSPRERDWQRLEAVQDMPECDWLTAEGGFTDVYDFLTDGVNPFEQGFHAVAQAKTEASTWATWTPEIDTDGRYAVYVSYVTTPQSIPDAHYVVRHSGIDTEVRVNQRMGGGTWVYLGTFHFEANRPERNSVRLSDESAYGGVVTADAVRLGGGQGNVARCDSLSYPIRSGLSRNLEGARYYVQYAGFPYEVYGTKQSQNDYGEDINARALAVNYLMNERAVPFDVAVAVHSDAGAVATDSIYGTLGIFTSGNGVSAEFSDSLLQLGILPDGRSRQLSNVLIDGIMTNVERDLKASLGKWTRREIWDKNYSETRLPHVPSVIIETLSHQNFADIRAGHDPWVKFILARAIYKGIGRWLSPQRFVVQPLPPQLLSATVSADGATVEVRWEPTHDQLEPTATADYYVLYTAVGANDFDNGMRVDGTSIRLTARRGELMRFRLTAANAGGQSLMSNELCAYAPNGEGLSILICDAFDRLAGPQPVLSDSVVGFDLDIDPGVPYDRAPCYTGRQLSFDPKVPSMLGNSGSEYEGLMVSGNTRDWATRHALDMISEVPGVGISSCVPMALDDLHLRTYNVIDYVAGAQRADGYSLKAGPAFTADTYRALATYANGGGRLLVSGAYLSEELDADFAHNVLGVQPAGTSHCQFIQGLGLQMQVTKEPNARRYTTRRTSVLVPSHEEAFPTALYVLDNQSASVASGRSLTFGFPLEQIDNEAQRRAVMRASITYLTQDE